MRSENLIQILKDRLDLESQISEIETTVAVQCKDGECRAIVAHPIEGGIRLFEVISREIGLTETI